MVIAGWEVGYFSSLRSTHIIPHPYIILVDSLIFTGFNLPCLAAVSSLHHFASFYLMIRGKFTGRRAPASTAHLGLHGAVRTGRDFIGAPRQEHWKDRRKGAGASRRPQW